MDFIRFHRRASSASRQVGRKPVAVLSYGSYYSASRTYCIISYHQAWTEYFGEFSGERRETHNSHYLTLRLDATNFSVHVVYDSCGIQLSRPCCVVQGKIFKQPRWPILVKAQSRITIPFVIHIRRQMGTPVPAAPQLCSIIPSPDTLPANSR